MSFINLPTAAAAALLVFGVAAAQAQQTPPPASHNPAPPMAGVFDDPGVFQREAWRRNLDQQARGMPSKARWARARKAAELINANRCDEARSLAASERDNELVARIITVCAAPKS